MLVKKLKKSFRLLLAILISVEIVIGGGYQLRVRAEPVGEPDDLSKKLAQEASEDPQTLKNWNQAADIVENGGDITKLPSYDPDPFFMSNQSIVLNGKTYNLQDYHIEIPNIAVTDLKVTYDKKSKTLIFEGYRGLNQRGSSGTLVARHLISNIDVAAMIQDEELLQFVDSQGNLHAIPMDNVVQKVFKEKFPVFKNLWQPNAKLNLSGKNFELKYGTIGLKPIDFKDQTITGILPKDKNGKVSIYAGDLFIYADGQLLGVYSRQATYNKIIRGTQYLLEMLAQTYPANIEEKLLPVVMKMIQDQDNKEAAIENFESKESTTPEVMRRALIHFQDAQGLINTANQQKGRGARNFQPLSEGQWPKEFTEIIRLAKAQSDELASIIGNPLSKQSQIDDASHQKVQLDKLIENGDLSSVWKEFYANSNLNPTRHEQLQQSRSWIKNKAKLSLKYLTPFLGIGAVFGFPHIYEHVETLRKIKVLEWMYTNTPAVLKDQEYRWPLLYSTISLVTLWPAAVLISGTIGLSLKILAKAAQNSSSRRAQMIRDLARNWSNITAWQRITSFGMRVYSATIYPATRIFIKTMQPQFLTAWLNNLNPFQKINPNSQIGKKSGLTQPMRVGTGKLFGKAEKKSTQLRVQSVLADREQRIKNLAWQMAAVVVAQKEQIDPATIELIMKKGINPKDLEKIFASKEHQRDWEQTSDKILTLLDGIGDGLFDASTNEITGDLLLKYKTYVEDIVKQIKGQTLEKKIINKYWRRFKEKATSFSRAAVTIGMPESTFLRTVFTNKFVSEQVERDFVPDHLMVVFLYALWGDRANLAQPEDLAANANGVWWTSDPHWVDVFFQTYIHFFVSGSRLAVNVQSVKAHDSTNYEPLSNLWVDNLPNRNEGFLKSGMLWVRNVLDPRASNIGYWSHRGFYKRFAMIQSNLATMVAIRMIGPTGQSFESAMLGYLLVFFAQQWFFGWPWDFIVVGNMVEGDRMEEIRQKLKEAFAMITASANEPDQNRSKEQAREGYEQLLSLYKKYNPKALEQIQNFMSQKGFYDLLDEQKLTLSEQNFDYMGIVAKLKLAWEKGDRAKVDELAGQLRSALARYGEEASELEKLNAGALLDFAFQNNPIPMRSHPAVPWLTTFVFGATATTAMSIPLSVMSFKPEYLTIPYVAMWFGINATGYWLIKRALTSDGWMAKGLNRIDKWWADKKMSIKVNNIKTKVVAAKDRVVEGPFYRYRINQIDKLMYGRQTSCNDLFQ